MRILTVANHVGSRGGLERTQLANCRALADRGHEIDLLYVTPGDFLPEWQKLCRTTLRVPGFLPRRRQPLSSVAGVLRTTAAGARLRPQVLYVYRYWDLPYAALLGRLTGCPLVFHLCLPPPDRLPWWLRAALVRVAATLSVSADTAMRWRETGLPPDTVTVVLTGVDLGRFTPASDDQLCQGRAELKAGVDDVVILYAGRIGREKGLDVLVEAFLRLAAERNDVRLVVVGSASLGADPEDSERYAAELRAAAAQAPVTFLPGRPDVVDLLRCADVAVVPSLWPEPLARSVLEPLACGVPVVASQVGGNPEVLSGWLAGMLVR
ncbi:MAG TPA: glycosyltransferase family 4 protein, partial [Acidimicrobiales bacterium]|nr:glycosyltransferase family 4 protein [Acidimicrobiales bacterium]